jgi:hypothetical protein
MYRHAVCDLQPRLLVEFVTVGLALFDGIDPLSSDKLRDTLSPTYGEAHDDSLPCPNGLSEVRSELVLELYGSLRTGRREVSGRATWPDHGRRHAAETLGYPSRQP